VHQTHVGILLCCESVRRLDCRSTLQPRHTTTAKTVYKLELTQVNAVLYILTVTRNLINFARLNQLFVVPHFW